MSTCNYYNKKWCHYIWRWDGKNPKDKKKIVAEPLWGRNFFSQSAKIGINRHFSSFHTAVTIGNLWKRTQRAKHSGWKPLRIERWWIKQIWMRTWGLVHVHRHVLEREREKISECGHLGGCQQGPQITCSNTCCYQFRHNYTLGKDGPFRVCQSCLATRRVGGGDKEEKTRSFYHFNRSRVVSDSWPTRVRPLSLDHLQLEPPKRAVRENVSQHVSLIYGALNSTSI